MVECHTHGPQPEAFVCVHVMESLRSGVGAGFFWPASSDQERPDAWCSSCEEARVEGGGDWNAELSKRLQVKLICGRCYDRAKDINFGAGNGAA